MSSITKAQLNEGYVALTKANLLLTEIVKVQAGIVQKLTQPRVAQERTVDGAQVGLVVDSMSSLPAWEGVMAGETGPGLEKLDQLTVLQTANYDLRQAREEQARIIEQLREQVAAQARNMRARDEELQRNETHMTGQAEVINRYRAALRTGVEAAIKAGLNT